MSATLKIATRKSPLALAQTTQVKGYLESRLPDCSVDLLEMSTTGDRKQKWSLEERGGKGLFTKELEEALLEGRADIAVHSAKDLPTELPAGLCIAGYLPRIDVRDVLVRKADVENPVFIATSSPRRRSQMKRLRPEAVFEEIRGNVDTRLRKVSGGHADATLLAAAGLQRLGISAWEGLVFEPLPIDAMVPAVGQAAIALQCREADADRFVELLDAETARAVDLERRYLTELGGGCHTAHAAHFDGKRFLVHHESHGMKIYEWDALRGDDDTRIQHIIAELTNDA